MSKKIEKKTIRPSVRFDLDFYQDACEFAKIEGISFNTLVENSLRFYMAKDVNSNNLMCSKVEQILDRVDNLSTKSEVVWFLMCQEIKLQIASSPDLAELFEPANKTRHNAAAFGLSKILSHTIAEINQNKPDLMSRLEAAINEYPLFEEEEGGEK